MLSDSVVAIYDDETFARFDAVTGEQVAERSSAQLFEPWVLDNTTGNVRTTLVKDGQLMTIDSHRNLWLWNTDLTSASYLKTLRTLPNLDTATQLHHLGGTLLIETYSDGGIGQLDIDTDTYVYTPDFYLSDSERVSASQTANGKLYRMLSDVDAAAYSMIVHEISESE